MSDLLPLIRNIFGACVLCALVPSAHAQDFVPPIPQPRPVTVCELKESENRADLKANDSLISVVGMSRLSPQSAALSRLAEKIKLAHQQQLTEGCDQAMQSLATALRGFEGSSKNHLNLIAQLRQMQFERPINEIITGLTEAETRREVSLRIAAAKPLQDLGLLCGPSREVADILAELQLLQLGPEIVFSSQQSQTIPIIGLEDETRVIEFSLLRSRLGRSLGEIENSKLAPEAERAFENIVEMKTEGHAVVPAEVDLAVAAQNKADAGYTAGAPDTPMGARLREGINAFLEMSDNVTLRNTELAEKLLSAPGRFVVLIEPDRVADLSRQLQRQCKLLPPQ